MSVFDFFHYLGQARELWQIVLTYGAWGVVFVGSLAFAWFSPIFKKTALWVATSIVLILGSYSVGIKMERDASAERIKFLQDRLEADVKGAVNRADDDVRSRLRDPWDEYKAR